MQLGLIKQTKHWKTVKNIHSFTHSFTHTNMHAHLKPDVPTLKNTGTGASAVVRLPVFSRHLVRFVSCTADKNTFAAYVLSNKEGDVPVSYSSLMGTSSRGTIASKEPVLQCCNVVMEITVCSKKRTSTHSFNLLPWRRFVHDTAPDDNLLCKEKEPGRRVRAHAAPTAESHPLHLTSQQSGPWLVKYSSWNSEENERIIGLEKDRSLYRERRHILVNPKKTSLTEHLWISWSSFFINLTYSLNSRFLYFSIIYILL